MPTALITGASRGLGKALAAEFAENGYDLILHSKSTEILKIGNCCDIVHGDLQLMGTILRLGDIAEKRDIDVLVNNAGVYLRKSFADTSYSDFREMIDVNLMAPILLMKRVWPVFQRKGRGLVININSLAGKNGGHEETAYCASKYGLRGFSNAVQFDAVKAGVRAISVYVGAMKTEMCAHKEGVEKFIEVEEAAQSIVALCKNWRSMRVTEVVLERRQY